MFNKKLKKEYEKICISVKDFNRFYSFSLRGELLNKELINLCDKWASDKNISKNKVLSDIEKLLSDMNEILEKDY